MKNLSGNPFDPAFIKELDFVMEQDGRIIGQNMFMRTIIEADDDRTISVLTMGPICIANDLKRQGYGKVILDYSLVKAAELGFGAVLFEGNIDFYGKSGFDFASKFDIRYHDLPEDADSSFFLCKELKKGYLDGISGVYQTPQGYYVSDADVGRCRASARRRGAHVARAFFVFGKIIPTAQVEIF